MPQQGHPLTAIRRLGLVNNVDFGPPVSVNVNLGGDTTQPLDLPFAGSVVPKVGDVVIILSIASGDHIVIGPINVPNNPVQLSAGGTTDAIGYATVNHGLSFTPSQIYPVSTLTGGSPASATGIAIDNITIVSFRIRFGSITAPSAFTINYLAWR